MKIVYISINFYSHVSTACEYASAVVFETYPLDPNTATFLGKCPMTILFFSTATAYQL